MHPQPDFSINVSFFVLRTTHPCSHHSEVTVPLSCHISISNLIHIHPTHTFLQLIGDLRLSITLIAAPVYCLITKWLSSKYGLFGITRGCTNINKGAQSSLALMADGWDSQIAWMHYIYEHVYFYRADFPSCFSDYVPQRRCNVVTRAYFPTSRQMLCSCQCASSTSQIFSHSKRIPPPACSINILSHFRRRTPLRLLLKWDIRYGGSSFKHS